MRIGIVVALIAVGAFGSHRTVAQGDAGQQGGRGRGAAAAQTVPNAPADKTAFWPAADIEARWKENEARTILR